MVLAAVRHEIAAAEQWDVEINSPSYATQPSHSLLALTGWILGAIDGHPLRRVGEAAEGGEVDGHLRRATPKSRLGNKVLSCFFMCRGYTDVPKGRTK